MSDINQKEIAHIIVKWCIANGEEFLPNPLASKIMSYVQPIFDSLRAQLAEATAGAEKAERKCEENDEVMSEDWKARKELDILLWARTRELTAMTAERDRMKATLEGIRRQVILSLVDPAALTAPEKREG